MPPMKITNQSNKRGVLTLSDNNSRLIFSRSALSSENYEDGMELYEAMIKYVAKETWGTLQFKVGGFEVDLDQPWPRVKYADLLMEKFGM